MARENLDVCGDLSLDPGVLSLFENPAGDNTITSLTEDVSIATHLAGAIAGDSCDGINGVEATALKRCQFQIFAAADDVAAVEMATGAVQ